MQVQIAKEHIRREAVHLTVLEAMEGLQLALAGDGRPKPEAMPLLGVLAEALQHLRAYAPASKHCLCCKRRIKATTSHAREYRESIRAFAEL